MIAFIFNKSKNNSHFCKNFLYNSPRAKSAIEPRLQSILSYLLGLSLAPTHRYVELLINGLIDWREALAAKPP
jgi:hypothetical protein